MHDYLSMYLSKCACILSSYIKLVKICSYFPRNFMINPGVNFWVSIQCGENTTLFKIPFMLWMSLLTRFSPSIFLFSVLSACPQTDTWVCIYICGSIATQMWTNTNVHIYPGKGQIWIMDWQFWLWVSDSGRTNPSATFQCSINNQAPDLGAAAGVIQKGRNCKCKLAVI